MQQELSHLREYILKVLEGVLTFSKCIVALPLLAASGIFVGKFLHLIEYVNHRRRTIFFSHQLESDFLFRFI